MDVDDNGVPTDRGEYASPHCPSTPCRFCTGKSAVREDGRLLTSWEWCRRFDTCAATVDWDRVFNR